MTLRTTTSRLPVSVPAQTLRDYNKVVATGIHITTDLFGQVRLSARFDVADGDSILPGHQFRIELSDLESEEGMTPRLTEALDNLIGILGRYYTRHHIESEINRLEHDDPKQDNLRIARDAAESDLRAPVTRTRTR